MIFEVQAPILNCNAAALHEALATVFGSWIVGVSTYPPDPDTLQPKPVSIWFIDHEPSQPEVEQALQIANTYNPAPLPDPFEVDLATAVTQAGANPLNGITVTQALTWIDANVTDLASAKVALKHMVKVIGVQERRLRIVERMLNIGG